MSNFINIQFVKEQEAKTSGQWLIEFGAHLPAHPNTLIGGEIQYEPTGELRSSLVSYENACKISLTISKKAS